MLLFMWPWSFVKAMFKNYKNVYLINGQRIRKYSMATVVYTLSFC